MRSAANRSQAETGTLQKTWQVKTAQKDNSERCHSGEILRQRCVGAAEYRFDFSHHRLGLFVTFVAPLFSFLVNIVKNFLRTNVNKMREIWLTY